MGRHPRWTTIVGLVAVVWLLGTVVLGGALVIEREHTSCQIADSTYGDSHWQWIPPGTYCTYDGSSDVPAPAFAVVRAQRARTRSVAPSAASPAP